MFISMLARFYLRPLMYAHVKILSGSERVVLSVEEAGSKSSLTVVILPLT